MKLHSLRLTWKLPEGLCIWKQFLQSGPESFHVGLGEGKPLLDFDCGVSRLGGRSGHFWRDPANKEGWVEKSEGNIDMEPQNLS